jgi:hypothetical protein
MRIYTIHLPPPTASFKHEAVVVCEGFNWWAFLFTGLWALSVRMWLMGVVLILVTGALAAGLDYTGAHDIATGVVMGAVSVWIGAEANDWRRAHLARKGWHRAAVIAAPDRDAALRRYLDLSALGPMPA